MPNLIITKKTFKSSFKIVIDNLPYNTADIRKSLAESGILDRSSIDKWYSGTWVVKNAYTIAKVAEHLNKHFPNANRKKITISDLLN